MGRLLTPWAIVLIVAGAAFTACRPGHDEPKPAGPETPLHLVEFPDAFFAKCGLDKTVSARRALQGPPRTMAKEAHGKDNRFKVIEAPSAGGLQVAGAPPCALVSATTSPDDKRYAAICKDDGLILWDTDKLYRLGCPPAAADAKAKNWFLGSLRKAKDWLIGFTRKPDKTQRPICSLAPDLLQERPMAFSPDSKTLAVGAANGDLSLWDTAKGERSDPIHKGRSDITAFAFSPDGKSIALGSQDGAVHIFDMAGDTISARVQAFDKPIVSVGFDPANPALLFAGTSAADPAVGAGAWFWQKEDVDFSTGSPQNPPYPHASARLADAGAVAAGSPAQVDVTVDNSKGRGELFQLVAVTTGTGQPAMDERLVFFGKIPAKGSAKRRVTLETDRTWTDQDIPLRLRFIESNDNAPSTISVTIPIQSLPQPAFTVTAQYYDGFEGRGLGNGDKRIQVGETPQIDITVSNSGAGPAGKSTMDVALDPPQEGLQTYGDLHKEVGGLEPGQGMTLTFDAAIKSTFRGKAMKFTVTVREDMFGVDTKQSLPFPVEPAP